MTYVFLPDAQEEFNETALYYEIRTEGLGVRFRNEINSEIQRILADPCIRRERPGGFRRANCHRFSHYIAYSIHGQTIVILAIAHSRRRSNYWKSRIK